MTELLRRGGHYIGYNPMPKFQNDKLFYQDDEKVVVLDGVVFNSRELMKKLDVNDWPGAFERLYKDDGRLFMDKLRGSFCGVVIDKRKDCVIAFSNHSGERALYYYNDKSRGHIIGSHVNFIEDVFLNSGLRLSMNRDSVYEILSNGSCLGNKTPFNGVHRITAGKCAILRSGREAEEGFYHLFKNTPERDIPLDEAIDEGNRLFRQAIKRIYGKNEEYGYKSECDLSGGLDSRMATWVAHDMGYDNVVNICYCVKGKIDHTTSRKIAHDLGNEYYFLAMDGNVQMDADRNVDLVGGQVYYGVGGGSIRALNAIDTSNIGLSVTGLLGELQNAYWVEGKKHTPPGYITPGARYSNYYPLAISDELKKPYDNYEQMNMYELSCNLFMSSALVRQQAVEVTSPFVDADYLDFVYRLPLKYRMHYKYITELMMKYYPEAAKYVWQTKGEPVETWYKHKTYIPRLLSKFTEWPTWRLNSLFRVMHVPFRFYRKGDMNPMDTWYYRNKAFREWMHSYAKKNMHYVKDAELRKRLAEMFRNGKTMDKLLVINMVAIHRRYIR